MYTIGEATPEDLGLKDVGSTELQVAVDLTSETRSFLGVLTQILESFAFEEVWQATFSTHQYTTTHRQYKIRHQYV